MPSSIEDQCDDYIDKYTDAIIEFVLKDLTPDEICAELKLCQVEIPPKLTISIKDSKCILCEYVMTTLDTMLANKVSLKKHFYTLIFTF
jgi:hypothetical protein